MFWVINKETGQARFFWHVAGEQQSVELNEKVLDNADLEEAVYANKHFLEAVCKENGLDSAKMFGWQKTSR